MGSAAERRLHNLHRQLAAASVVEAGLERMDTSTGNAQSIWQSTPQVYSEPSGWLLSFIDLLLVTLKVTIHPPSR